MSRNPFVLEPQLMTLTLRDKWAVAFVSLLECSKFAFVQEQHFIVNPCCCRAVHKRGKLILCHLKLLASQKSNKFL